MKASCAMNALPFVKVGYGLSNLTSTLSNASRDRFGAMKRTMRKNWDAAEDLMDDVTRSVKKQPMKAMIPMTISAPPKTLS